MHTALHPPAHLSLAEKFNLPSDFLAQDTLHESSLVLNQTQIRISLIIFYKFMSCHYY